MGFAWPTGPDALVCTCASLCLAGAGIVGRGSAASSPGLEEPSAGGCGISAAFGRGCSTGADRPDWPAAGWVARSSAAGWAGLLVPETQTHSLPAAPRWQSQPGAAKTWPALRARMTHKTLCFTGGRFMFRNLRHSRNKMRKTGLCRVLRLGHSRRQAEDQACPL